MGANTRPPADDPKDVRDAALAAKIAEAIAALLSFGAPAPDGRKRSKMEIRLRTLDRCDPDSIDRLDDRTSPAEAGKLDAWAKKLRQLADEVQADAHIVALNALAAKRLRSSIIEARDAAARLAAVAAAGVVAHRPRQMADDVAVWRLAECWYIAFGAWPKVSPAHTPDETSADGSVKVVDAEPFAGWAVHVLRLLRPDHLACASAGAPIADARARLRKDGVNWPAMLEGRRR